MSGPGTSPPNEPPGGDETFTSVEIIVANFRAQWRGGRRQGIAAFLPSPDQPHRGDVLRGLIAAELAERLRAGEEARIEEYLDRFPELGPAARLPCELIAAEYHARRAQGETVAMEEYARRFPAQIAGLKAELLAAGGGPTAEDQPPIDLEPGAVLGDYEIVRLLGSGSYARVYLARQRSLDRLVAIKVSAQLGEEGRTLARLDHPHIVPVFSQQVIAGHRVLAMRYVPGRTLADWICRRKEIDLRTWRGGDLLAWLDEEAAGPRDGGSPGRAEFASLRFAPAVCRMVLELAEALEHAHRQGVLHRDIKPANVLLDHSAQAFLMDFNVAVHQAGGAGGREPLLGGTIAYMAPEHLAAILSDVPGTEAEVDRRSDIYSLGVVFYELLTGSHPWPHADTSSVGEATIRQVMAARLHETPRLPARLPGVSPGLRSIVEKCLAPRREDRYQSAAELAEDLGRLSANRPLATAPDPSAGERAAKWIRRHPRTLAVVATLVLIGAVLTGYAGSRDLRRLGLAGDLLGEAAELADTGHSSDAGRKLIAAQAAISQPNLVVPERFTAARRSGLEDRLATIATRVAGLELDRFQRDADTGRAAAFGLAGTSRDLAADPLEVYHVLDRPDWEQLPQFCRLDPQQRAWVAEDVTELLLTRAIAVGEASADTEGAAASRTERMLDLLGRVPAAQQDAAVVKALLGHVRQEPHGRIKAEALAVEATGEFDCYLAGVAAAQQGDFALALDCLDRALRRRPPDRPPRFWARFLHAYCNERLGQDEAAIADYGMCIGLREDFAWSYHNLGLIYTRRDSRALAVDNLRQAVRLAPDLPEAHANLGVALFLADRFTEARDAFDQAINLGYHTAEGYSNRAAARQALGDLEGAREDLGRALQIDPDSEAARENLRRLDASQ